MSNFQDIKIVGMDETASKRPDPNKSRYDIVLTLSASAPSEWSEYFNKRWADYIYGMKRNAYVYGSKLTIHCAIEDAPEDLEQDHLPELKKIIEEINQQYKEYLQAQKSQKKKEIEYEKAEKQKLDNLKKRIKFD